jgi:hypothetical protein
MGKKAYSVGFSWTFALISLFAIGVMYIVFNQVFLEYLVPTIKTAVNTTNVNQTTVMTIYANIDKYMFLWNLTPLILFGAIVAYLIFVAIRKEQQDEMF